MLMQTFKDCGFVRKAESNPLYIELKIKCCIFILDVDVSMQLTNQSKGIKVSMATLVGNKNRE